MRTQTQEQNQEAISICIWDGSAFGDTPSTHLQDVAEPHFLWLHSPGVPTSFRDSGTRLGLQLREEEVEPAAPGLLDFSVLQACVLGGAGLFSGATQNSVISFSQLRAELQKVLSVPSPTGSLPEPCGTEALSAPAALGRGATAWNQGPCAIPAAPPCPARPARRGRHRPSSSIW